MKRRQKFEIKFFINYRSGKRWMTKFEAIALSEYGALEIFKWLNLYDSTTIISVNSLGYVGSPIYEDRSTLGDF